MGILHEIEENERLRVRRIEALIFGRIVILHHDYGVLTLANVHIIGKQIPVLVG